MVEIGKRIEIMLVEDNPGDVELALVAFRRSKIANHVEVARNGLEALQILAGECPKNRGWLPELILLDLNMPGKNGYEVLREVKSNTQLKHIPVIVFTSSSAHTDVMHSYELRANFYVTKPATLEALEDVVRAMETFWCQVVRLPGKKA